MRLDININSLRDFNLQLVLPLHISATATVEVYGFT